ncbi:peptidoglycan DD-metalloendopeptidase family protein [Altererythrobacter sp. KTW20L]|uniref:murein hydrolase activator EnvC family protein n=1 Tax=Altererythrobacter sp. KTW20L TaxID=2942210 RepID=UPI0020C0D47D|nr:peptidoglycan DD-metalloendopeptidase family protein [Altererythrobacter sp. KTW20L]MCL6249911.1 peptidoglycan DD-metalloendopeptidase family protein [Altererythrobacter sp. KTW20L]
MSRMLVLLFACAVLGTAAMAQRAPVFEDAGETRAALQQALAEREAAEARSVRLEAEAAASQDAVDRTARQAAALAARVQQAEAGIAAADARLALIGEEQARLRSALGREQRPIVTLTAALQQFSRRPVALSLLRPGEVRDLVYLRAVMASTVPQVEARTVALRAAIDRQAVLRQETTQATQVLRQEEAALAERRTELAALEARQRLAAREAGSLASREAERALALGEQARDLDALVGELDRAAVLRNRLAELPGPLLRPEGNAPLVAEEPAAITSASAPVGAPAPYILPVAGRTVTGFGAPVSGVLSQGLTLAPRSNAQVVAPAAGRVAFAGPYRGYGRIVIIEHAGGWTSLVTGLARSDVAVGDELVGGAPIGVAGPGRPTVTLELRRDGEAVNPLEFAR